MPTPTDNPFTALTRPQGFEVAVENPGHKTSMFPALVGFDNHGDASSFAKDLFGTLKKAEKRFDKGKGDTSDPEAGDPFQVMATPNGEYMVHVDGVEVATYKNKKKANAVANALNDEVEKRKLADECYDPDPLGERRNEK